MPLEVDFEDSDNFEEPQRANMVDRPLLLHYEHQFLPHYNLGQESAVSVAANTGLLNLELESLNFFLSKK